MKVYINYWHWYYVVFDVTNQASRNILKNAVKLLKVHDIIGIILYLVRVTI